VIAVCQLWKIRIFCKGHAGIQCCKLPEIPNCSRQWATKTSVEGQVPASTLTYEQRQYIVSYWGKLAFFRENAKSLRFDALIEKEGYMYKSEDGRTPRRTTRPKNRKIANLGEQNAHASSARVRPLPRLGNYVVEQGCHWGKLATTSIPKYKTFC
jgi:hypothetical protein